MPDEVTPTSRRKADHIRINLEEDVHSGRSTGLEDIHLPHHALPELDLASVDTATTFLHKPVSAPILISSMTGGTDEALRINRNLADAAQASGVAMGVGSQRAAIENSGLAKSFQIRSHAPDIPLLANLGAVQLNYGYGVDECQRAVDMIEADALIFHLNPLQEALQLDGDTNFSGLTGKIEAVCQALSVPVIVKEVGWGISLKTARALIECGVYAIDVAGAGGTSWSQVEMYRSGSPSEAFTAALFRDWGLSTATSLSALRTAFPSLPLIASGGLRNGLELAKVLAMQADMGGFAGPMLKAAHDSPDAVIAEIERITREVRISMFVSGCKDIPVLNALALRAVQ